MRVWIALMLTASFAVIAGREDTPSAGRQAAEVMVFNRSGAAVMAITDGDLVRLEATLAETTWTPVAIDFWLAGAEKAVGHCRVAWGSRTCRTQPLLSLGWHWAPGGRAMPSRALSAWTAGRALARTTLQVAPRPVVMVHGFNADWTTWTTYLGPAGYLAGAGLEGFAVGDGQFPGALDTGSVLNPTARTNSIAENVAILGEYVDAVQAQTGAEMVDLVAHSMGGLISRYYIDRGMDGREVAQLITLGTPQAGTDCANLPASLGMLQPATLEIRPAYVMGIFNQQITRRHGAPFHALAGTTIQGPVGVPCSAAPTDEVVSLESAGAIPVNLDQIELLHHELNKAAAAFEAFVLPWLQTPAGGFTEEPDPPAPDPSFEPLQFTRVFTGHVPAGGSQQYTIQIEPGVAVANFALFDVTRSLSVTMIGASGNPIALDTLTHGLIVVDDPATMVYLGYGFENPRPGPWQVLLNATAATPATGADFALTAHLAGGVQLTANATPLLPEIGAPVGLAGSLTLAEAPLAIGQAEVLIWHPDGEAEVLPLTVTGSDFAGEWRPDDEGVYQLDIVVLAQTPDGTPVERTAFLAIQAQPKPTPVRTAAATVAIVGGVLCLLLALLVGPLWLGWRLVQRRRTAARR
jgi:pimeloyl-ACP methyl ester carboxylesterase